MKLKIPPFDADGETFCFAAGVEAGVVSSLSIVVAGAASVGWDTLVTGSSSWGAVADTAVGSASLTGITGAGSSVVGLVTSFFAKKLPKMEFLLLGLGAFSRAGVTAVGLVSSPTAPADGSTAAVVAVVAVST